MMRQALDRIHGLARKGYQSLKSTPLPKVIGYFNGTCPRCGTHIGANVTEEAVSGTRSLRCGACDAVIYEILRARGYELHEGLFEGPEPVDTE